MQISKIEDSNIWQSFIEKLNLNTFLHSLEWQNFNTLQNFKTWKLGLFDSDNKLISVALIIKVEARRGHFLFCPHGPQSVNNDNESQYKAELTEWTKFLKNLAKEENCCFFRIQPIVESNQQNSKVFADVGFRKSPIHMHTELSSVLNIDKTEEEILLGMRKTTRQMIKKGLKMIADGEVEIKNFDQVDDKLYRVYQETGSRGNFVIFSKKYLMDEFNSFNASGKTKLYGIYYKKELLSWGMVLFCGKRAFYHQGANILNKDVPASYLCQWTGIKFARDYGCETYDFWGVSPVDAVNHPWGNISIFKRGFGGQDVVLLHAQDYILDFRYWLTYAIETFRAKKRGFV